MSALLYAFFWLGRAVEQKSGQCYTAGVKYGATKANEIWTETMQEQLDKLEGATNQALDKQGQLERALNHLLEER